MFRKRWVPFFLSIGLGVLFWVVDALLDFLVYYPGTFLDLLILDPPRHELYIRAVVLALFTIFGYVVTRTIDAIRRSEERYRSIVNSSEIYICRFTPDTKLTFANAAYCERRGMTQEEIIGQSFMSWIPEKDQAFIRRQFQSLTPEDPVITYEHRVITRDGDVTWQRWTDEALFNRQGDLVEYQSIGYDIIISGLNPLYNFVIKGQRSTSSGRVPFPLQKHCGSWGWGKERVRLLGQERERGRG